MRIIPDISAEEVITVVAKCGEIWKSVFLINVRRSRRDQIKRNIGIQKDLNHIFPLDERSAMRYRSVVG